MMVWYSIVLRWLVGVGVVEWLEDDYVMIMKREIEEKSGINKVKNY